MSHRFLPESSRRGSLRRLPLPALFAAAVLLATSRTPLSAASATALITVRVLGHAGADVAQGAVTVNGVSDLDFGTVPAGVDGGAVVVAASSENAARQRIGGATHASFAVSLPDAVVVRNGSSAITVSSFTTSSDVHGNLLSEKGTATVGVGGTARMEPGQAPGLYAGALPMTVAYD